MHDTISTGAIYRRWLKFIAKDHPRLDGNNRGMLLAFAQVFADKGNDNGHGCFAGNGVIADHLECTRDTIARYKRIAIDAGWFTDTGRKVKRAQVYNIAIPDREPEPFKRVTSKRDTSNLVQYRPHKPKPSVTLSEPSKTGWCPRCEGRLDADWEHKCPLG